MLRFLCLLRGLVTMESSGAERTVFVIDDDVASRESLTILLGSEGLTAAGFASAREFLAALPAETRGCVITDLRMPDMDGVELLRSLKAAGSMLPVIVTSGHADVGRAVEAMKAGAADLIEKPYESAKMLRAVRACLDENDAAVDASAARTQVLRRMESLTARQRQVLELIMAGASNKVIALKLAISPRTVEIYRANVMAKMRAENLSELIRITLAAGVPHQAHGR